MTKVSSWASILWIGLALTVAVPGLATERLFSSFRALSSPPGSFFRERDPILLALLEEREHVDLNGDGDEEDKVLHLVNPETGELENLGIAIGEGGSAGPRGDLIYVRIDYANALLLDPRTGETRLLPGGIQGVTVAQDRIFVWVRESEDGNDLNGDGDVGDDVLQLYDWADDVIVNLGISFSYEIPGAGSHLGFVVREHLEGGTDLNGDGDAQDEVFHLLDQEHLEITNLGLQARILSFEGGEIWLTAPEPDLGGDFNGDGDEDDHIFAIYDVCLGEVVYRLPYAIGLPRPLSSGRLASVIQESSQGTDLNGDADLDDDVVLVFDPRTREVMNTGLAISGTFHVMGDQVVFSLREQSQGFVDFNGDGDANDEVVFAFDAESAHALNLAVAGFVMESGESQAALHVREAKQGRTDLNGDGDTIDPVLHIYDGNEVRNLEVALSGEAYFGRAHVDGDLVLTYVDERNRDGISMATAGSSTTSPWSGTASWNGSGFSISTASTIACRGFTGISSRSTST